ncbi:amino acid adenylation domain-containing protein [Micromonospora aurantiaca]|uniref:non-ribosomal peptide synthetase/type I polyketide synthase n=1 Tax=Micromonospora aurantiaca (nom. illeg.) TaxID=47850 RepID=UPI000F3C0AB2|nr:non-ribosomal peptide synthetase/type I polyketide synthase [Micromonospora aurantiaca]RNH97595.1 amino acid adenylation domain-containing protein [Micromonospora aurantiaca]
MPDDRHLTPSFEQERAYILDRLDATGPALNEYRALLVTAPLRADTVRRTLQQLTDRHEILRTGLVDRSGRPAQIVDDVEPELVVADLSAADDPLLGARELAATFVARPFVLDVAPLWRMLFARLDSERHVLVLSMHAAVADAETLMLFFREFFELCASTGGRAAPPRQYREHVARQQALDPEERARQEAYWREALSGELQPASLPSFHLRPAVRTYHADRHRSVLPAALAADAEHLAASTEVSLASVLTAGFAALLYRYGARAEATFGQVRSTRRADETMLGPCGNPVAVRVAMDSTTTFESALRLTADRLAQAEAHLDVPFQRVVRALEEREPGRTPLFQLVFDVELDLPAAADLARSTTVDVVDFDVAPRFVDYDLRARVHRSADGLAIDWVFDPKIFDPPVIAQVAGHFAQLLAAALGDTRTPIAELAYLGEEDLNAIRLRWNTERTPYRRECVHRLIQEQAERTPAAVAVEFAGERLTYADLDRRANRLARHLRSRGVAEGDMVGLCMDRSADQIVAVVAIFKAACVVVPLDAAYPVERLRMSVEDAGVRTVLTTGAPIPQFTDVTEIRMDTEQAAIDACDDTDPDYPCTPDAAAYCIYTSGSTGRPKGVVVEHAALANIVAWHSDTWLVGVGVRTLLYSPISFDVSFHEIAAGLCTGATLVAVDEETRRNPIELLEFTRRERIAKWYTPFVTLQQIAQAARTVGPPTTLRELIVGGEVLRITPEIRDFARRTGCVIHNHYGSTECIDVATHTLSGDPAHWPSVAPIGRANVHNMNLYILDDARQLVPLGVVGELYADGDSLSRGYQGRPELDAERFFPNPFAVQGSRLYRMGDLGRYLPDGTIECLGRVDNQVKIRGFRVEVSDVEAVLARHPAVAECAVRAVTANGRAHLAAYAVAHDVRDRAGLPETLRAFLADRLPDYMVPVAVRLLDDLPLTPSGKLDVRALPDVRVDRRASAPPKPSGLAEWIARVWCEVLDLPTVDPGKSFFELGGDSISLVQVHQRIEAALGTTLPATALFRYPTIEALSEHLEGSGSPGRPERPARPSRDDGRDVAIIGMACRVPGADNIDEFWSNLRNGVESIAHPAGVEGANADGDQTPEMRFVPASAALDGIDLFDAGFFGYSPAEAAVIDPQQRLFLECAWEAIEDAGAAVNGGRVGVFAGASLGTYLINNVLPAKLGAKPYLSHRHFDDATDLRIEQGNSRDHLPTRVSFKLNLSGPSVNVQSTCSTSLVAVHLARQALLNGECDVALAGGVSIITPQGTRYLWRDGMMLSSDGHCRAFDARADGTVFGNGLGAVVLKPLSAALADGDHVYAVLKGSAVNNDGALKVDYSGPSVQAQAEVIAEAHRDAGVRADQISYVEAHGTATRLGDPIEIAGLTEAFGRTATVPDGTPAYCAIGSVKTNIGHLDEASGVVGLIKTALSLHRRQIPPSLNFTSANPLAGLQQSPFFVNVELRDWPARADGPRLAGVSSFGMGGTNCHVILEEPPTRLPRPPHQDRPTHLLPVSGRTTQALRGNLERYLSLLDRHDDASLADICFSAATGRRHFDTRVAIHAPDVEDMRRQLAGALAEPDLAGTATTVGDRPRIGFLCTGQGSQYRGMGQLLYDTQPVYRQAIERCDAILRPLLGASLVAMLFGHDAEADLDDTGNAQPALFAVGYALSRLWGSWGIRPDVLVGHSLGEYVAACVAGVFSLEDGLKLVAARARLMQQLPRTGAMAQINAGLERVEPYLADHQHAVSIAAVNGPDSIVLSGRSDAVDAVCNALLRDGVETIRLKISIASHSPLMEPMLEPFRAVAESVQYSPPTTDIVSTLTGALVRPGEMESADYWVRHIVRPVLFDQAMRVVAESGVRVFVEAGSKPTLSSLADRCLTSPGVLWLPSMTARDQNAAVESLRRLYLAGAPVDWAGFDAPFHRRRVPVPTYAFQRIRHWIEAPLAAADGAGPVIGGEPAPAYEVVWERVDVTPGRPSAQRRFVVIGSSQGMGGRLAAALGAHGRRCEVYGSAALAAAAGITAAPGELHVILAPELPDGQDVPGDATALLAEARATLELATGASRATGLWLLTREGRLATPMSHAELSQSGMAALARTINTEHAELGCVALALPTDADRASFDLAVSLLGGAAPEHEEQLAVHGGQAYRARLVPVAVPSAGPGRPIDPPVRPDGVYLITGGTSGLGLRLAVQVARAKPRRVVLVSRRGQPPAAEAAVWAALVATGTPVECVQADVADEARMRQVLADCGPDLRGVFHCAGALDDGIFLGQTPERFAAVLRPKVDGAWNLHRHTRERDLDFFVMFSSLASLIGYPGQAGYGFANGLLDALARHRHQTGLPALSVSWGSWAASGMMSRLAEPERRRLAAGGESFLSEQAGLAALAALMNQPTPHVAVADMDWTALAHSRPRVTSMVLRLIRSHHEPDPQPTRGNGGQGFAARLRAVPPDVARGILRDTVGRAIQNVLADEVVDATRGFVEQGLDSLGALELRSRLQIVLDIDLPATVALQYPCLEDLVRHLEEGHFAAEISAMPADEVRQPNPSLIAPTPAPAEDAVAIIGMACRMPGANTPDEYWKLLVGGHDAIRDIPPERWDLDEFYDPSPDAPGKMYVRRAAFIDDIDCFDAEFFRISPREAACMDSRHRLLLETAWSAIESAGIDPTSLRGSDTAVYLGGDEFLNHYARLAAPLLGVEPYVSTGTTLSFMAGRLSYKLGLHGPSMVVSTACSSSLVAMHSAVRAIRNGDCGMALVGAAKLNTDPFENIQLCKLKVLSVEGVSKAFDAAADGLGRGEGCATVLLKRLDAAVADGDPVLAVIRGTAVNHDGPSAGLTVPNASAQTRLVKAALADARVDPADVTYVETHGAGTQLGDPIEINALAEAFRGRATPLRVGSTKANIGHLEEAAGLAGVIKTVLMLRHDTIPAQIHCETLTDKVNWANVPVMVERTGLAWPDEAPRIAGVSSFGASGTNAHVVLEAYPQLPVGAAAQRGLFVFTFSARDERDLEAYVRKFVDGIDPAADPAAVAYTLQIGRTALRCRLAVVASDLAVLRSRLAASLRGEADGPDVFRGTVPAGARGPVAGMASPPAPGWKHGDVARLWCDGQPVEWRRLYGDRTPSRVPLPTYPFKRVRLRIDATDPAALTSANTVSTALGPVEPETLHQVESEAPGPVAPETTDPRESETIDAPLTKELDVQSDLGPADTEAIDSLREHVAALLGFQPQELPETAYFDDLGADSLIFMRISQFVRERFGVVISFQQLIEEADTLKSLAALVSAAVPSASTAGPPPARRELSVPAAPSVVATVASPVAATPKAPASAAAEARFRSGPNVPAKGASTVERLTDRQERFLDWLIDAYVARTPLSKTAAERERSVMANCRMPAFQLRTKEMSYPIMVDRSNGARFHDIDDNEYVDISMGYGVHLFGYQPPFVLDALRAQLDKGIHIGPLADRAGEVARLLCDLTGMDRAAFCNSGTEAVMAALRFARAATGRTRFVMFEGSYHGWSDHTLALPAGQENSIPMARGIGTGAMNDVVVLEYGAPASLEAIRALGPDLAAVLVEPVQSRRPDLQPKEFLRELREVTRRTGTALIFDEIVTGFRVHPGGAQVWSGVEADLVTYGKVLGGGLPIGAVAGRAAFMDTIDGGQWNYGDDTTPTVPMTFFGGTFNKNPLSMVAAHAVLTHLAAQGPQLQHGPADEVTWLAEDFNAFCRRESFPLRIVHFSSVFRFIGEGEYSLQRFPLAIDLFFHLLALRGVYVLETRVCFLSTSHTRDDVRFVAETAKACLRLLRDGGFFGPPPTPAPVRVQARDRFAMDAALEGDFVVPSAAAARRGETDSILLTGATGYLGAHLIRDLLRQTSARVHCLVRARDAAHAHERVIANLAGHGCLDALAHSRVVGIAADLASPRLGLAEDQWRHLADEVGAIYHNGAHVNSLLPYEKLRAANVESTRELLRLAVDGRIKEIHYISSDAVFDAYGYLRQATIYEDEPLAHSGSLYGGGYAESKWVSDKLVENARAAGLRASIYRPGALTGALTGGCGQLGDFLARFIKGVIQLGSCPELDGTIDFAPVDVVSQTIVELAKSDSSGRTYHLTHPHPITYLDFVAAIRAAGYPVEVVPLHVWEARLGRLRYEDDNALYPLLSLFTESSAPVFRRARLDVANALGGTRTLAAACPPIRHLTPLYLDRYAADGFLPAPSAWSER